MKNKELIEFECRDIGENGEGIGTLSNGLTCFVKNILPGETGTITLSAIKKSTASGVLRGLTKASPRRRNPECRWFYKCGGCQIQTLQYSGQLEYKEKKTADALKRIGKIGSPPLLPIIAGSEEWDYRSKLVLPIQGNSKHPKIGFFKEKSHTIVEIDRCPVGKGAHETILAAMREAIRAFKISIYQETKKKGLLKYILCRYSGWEDLFNIVLVTARADLPKLSPLVKYLAQLSCVKGISINENPTSGNRILGEKTIPIYGEAIVKEKVLDLVWNFSPISFFQLNLKQTELLYQFVLKEVQKNASQTQISIIEFFSGIGLLTALLSKQAKKIASIEFSTTAVDDAKRNCAELGIDNITFFQGDALLKAEEMFASLGKAHTAILNPPRQGVSQELLTAIAAQQIDKIIYISCKPATLARDIALLSQEGYRLDLCQPFDMLPQTTHVENIAVLTRV